MGKAEAGDGAVRKEPHTRRHEAHPFRIPCHSHGRHRVGISPSLLPGKPRGTWKLVS